MSDLDQVRSRVVKDVLSELKEHDLVIVNSEDPLLARSITDVEAYCWRWFDYPGTSAKSWMSLVLAGMADSRAQELNRLKKDALVEKCLLQEKPQAGVVLVGRVALEHLSILRADLNKLKMRDQEGSRWKVLAFCAAVDTGLRDAKVISLRPYEPEIEKAIRDLLDKAVRPGKDKDKRADEKDKLQRILTALASAIAGLADCEFSRAHRLVTAVKSQLDNQKAELGMIHRRAALKLLKAYAPDTYHHAEAIGSLPEFVFGLQRAALKLGAAALSDPGAILGEEMPHGYSVLAGSLVFLRWYEELLGQHKFTGPDHVRSALEGTDQAKGDDSRIKLLEALHDALGGRVTKNGKKDQEQKGEEGASEPTSQGSDENSKEPERDWARWLKVLLAITGKSPSHAEVYAKSIEVMDSRSSASAISKVVKVVHALAEHIGKFEPDKMTLADARVILLVCGIHRQLQNRLYPRLVQLGGDSTFEGLPADFLGDERGNDALREELVEKRNKTVKAFIELVRSAKSEIDGLAKCVEGLIRDRGLHQSLIRLSRSTASRLDISVEKLRFQLYLVEGSWAEAERHLELMRRYRDSRAEITEAEIGLLEAGYIEARGNMLRAHELYSDWQRRLDPSVDPVSWSRASYGAARTELYMKSRPETAVLAAATALIDIEGQRSERITKTEKQVFFSFRGSVRATVKRMTEAVARLDFKCEADDTVRAHDDFDPALQLRLLSSRFIVIVLSRDYFESPWCLTELHTALHMAQFDAGCRVAWMFVYTHFDGADEHEAEEFIRNQIALSSRFKAPGNDAYLEERVSRLMALGTRVGRGVFSQDKLPSDDDWTRFFGFEKTTKKA